VQASGAEANRLKLIQDADINIVPFLIAHVRLLLPLYVRKEREKRSKHLPTFTTPVSVLVFYPTFSTSTIPFIPLDLMLLGNLFVSSSLVQRNGLPIHYIVA
jgi:hypothetical protein